VILIAAGTYGNVVRFLTPLTITDDELNEGLDVLSECFVAVTTQLAAR
jgi:4-aminobutyrate aminotransferase/(S)-3-amino-2-methylpropionate transaminase